MAGLSSRSSADRRDWPNGYVKWWQLLSLLIGMAGIQGGVMSTLWSMHSDTPHKGAVLREEFDHRVNNVDGRLGRIEDKIDILIQRSTPL